MQQEELFQNYLLGKLSPEDQKLLEKLLAESPRYQAELELFRKTWKNPQANPDSKLSSWLISLVIALAIVGAGIFLFYTFGLPKGSRWYASYYQPYPVAQVIPSVQNNQVKQGLESYQSKRYEEAIQSLERMMAQSESELVIFHLGLSYLAAGRPEKAIPVLGMIPRESNYAIQTAWYKAMGYLKLNKLEEAKAQLRLVANSQSEFSSKASELLEKMD
ncbi:MAG: hypothetical protein LPK25_02350 [Cyclobacteriaceae bacterium]|nr:hypothetical protein [Cyclobacteriaceae bacterium]MDX5465631.1 hypothetical protein [Cyclobacteriaceae bacterium]